MAQQPPAFQLYAADFYMDTAAWSAQEVGAYFRLLMHEWVNGPLPNNNSALARIAGVDPRNMQKMWSAAIANKFVADTAKTLINLRLENTRKEQEEYRKKQSESGHKGVEAKKKKGSYPFNKSSDPSSDPSSNPATQNQALQSSSSLSTLQGGSYISGGEAALDEKTTLLETLKPQIEKLYPHWPQVHAFCMEHLNNGHAGAMEKIFGNLLRHIEKHGTENMNCWGYCERALKVENGNFHEQDNIKQAQDQKTTRTDGKQTMKSFKEIMTNISQEEKE